MKDKIQSLEEIKEIERQLYLKKSKIAGEEAMEYGETLPSLFPKDSSPDELKRALSTLIRYIGQESKGGNSVEDVREERRR